MARVRRVTSELEALNAELYRALAEEDGTPKKQFASLASYEGENLTVFKSAVDQLRRLLWFYLENAAVPEISQQEGPDELRLQDATAPAAASVSFFDRLNVVIEGYIQHNRVRSKAKP
jgi:hypothetical protein